MTESVVTKKSSIEEKKAAGWTGPHSKTCHCSWSSNKDTDTTPRTYEEKKVDGYGAPIGSILSRLLERVRPDIQEAMVEIGTVEAEARISKAEISSGSEVGSQRADPGKVVKLMRAVVHTSRLEKCTVLEMLAFVALLTANTAMSAMAGKPPGTRPPNPEDIIRAGGDQLLVMPKGSFDTEVYDCLCETCTVAVGEIKEQLAGLERTEDEADAE